MPHAGRHEQSHAVLRAASADVLHQRLVEVHRGLRGNQAIGPAVRKQQLAAALEEAIEPVGRDVERVAAVIQRALGVAVVVEAAEVPGRIVEHRSLEECGGYRERLLSHGQRGHLRLAAHCKTGIDLFARARILRPRIDGANRGHLLLCEAIGRVARLALEHHRIEAAGRRMADDAVVDAVVGITGRKRRLLHHLQLGGRHTAGLVLHGGRACPQRHDHQRHHLVGGRHGRDAVVVIGIAICLHQPDAAARGAARVQRALRASAVERGDGGLRGHSRFVHRAMTEIGELLRMAGEERTVERTALVAHIRSRRGVAARQRAGHVAIGDGSRPHAVAATNELAVPAGERHPHFEADVRIRRGLRVGRHAAECGQCGVVAARSAAHARRSRGLELARRHFLGGGDGDIG